MMSSIREARKRAGLTQKSMSEMMGIPKRTIEDWERGIMNPPSYVERLVIKELNEIENRKRSE